MFAQMEDFLKMVSIQCSLVVVRGGQSLLQAYGTPGAEERN